MIIELVFHTALCIFVCETYCHAKADVVRWFKARFSKS